MSTKHPDLDPVERAREKQASREADARAIAEGRMSPDDLARKNVFLSAERFEIDFDRAVPLR